MNKTNCFLTSWTVETWNSTRTCSDNKIGGNHVDRPPTGTIRWSKRWVIQASHENNPRSLLVLSLYIAIFYHFPHSYSTVQVIALHCYAGHNTLGMVTIRQFLEETGWIWFVSGDSSWSIPNWNDDFLKGDQNGGTPSMDSWATAMSPCRIQFEPVGWASPVMIVMFWAFLSHGPIPLPSVGSTKM